MTAPSVGSQIAARFVASDDVATREQLRAAIDTALSVLPHAALLDAARDFEWFGRLEIQPGQRGLAQAHDKMRTALESQPAAIAGDSVQALLGTWDARAKAEHAASQDKNWAEWLRDRHHGASGAFSTCKLELEAALSAAPAAPDGGVLTALQECRDKRQAAPAPVADGAVSEMVRTAPERIYLQVADEDYSHESFPHDSEDQVTWCASSCVECEVEYVRADLAQDRASQGAAAGVPEADLVDAAMSVLNDNNGKIGKRKFRADATAVVRRVLRMLAAAPSAPTQGAEREVGRG